MNKMDLLHYLTKSYQHRYLMLPRGLCLVHTPNADKTRLSRLIGGVNWVGDSRRQFSVVLNILETEQFRWVLSAVWTHLWTSLDPVSKYDVTIGNHVACELLETGSRQDKTQFTPHFTTGQNCFKIFSRRQTWLVANSVHTADANKTRQDKTVLSCWCELDITVQ